jgi:hypothetical protein
MARTGSPNPAGNPARGVVRRGWMRARLCAAIAAGVSCGAPRPLAQPPSTATAPCLEVAGVTPEDCGAAKLGTTVIRTVLVTNTSKTMVRLRVASKSCGCVATDFDRDELEAGESASLTLSTTVAPVGGGEQVHYAIIEASGLGANGRWAALCTTQAVLRYTPDFDYLVTPARHLLLHAVAGASTEFCVYVNGPHFGDFLPTDIAASDPPPRQRGLPRIRILPFCAFTPVPYRSARSAPMSRSSLPVEVPRTGSR